MATSNGYKTFVIPDNIGGRFSVLTPGLLPIALGGFNIREIVDGAKMESMTRNNKDAVSNPALIYAATRNLLWNQAKQQKFLLVSPQSSTSWRNGGNSLRGE